MSHSVVAVHKPSGCEPQLFLAPAFLFGPTGTASTPTRRTGSTTFSTRRLDVVTATGENQSKTADILGPSIGGFVNCVTLGPDQSYRTHVCRNFVFTNVASEGTLHTVGGVTMTRPAKQSSTLALRLTPCLSRSGFILMEFEQAVQPGMFEFSPQ